MCECGPKDVQKYASVCVRTCDSGQGRGRACKTVRMCKDLQEELQGYMTVSRGFVSAWENMERAYEDMRGCAMSCNSMQGRAMMCEDVREHLTMCKESTRVCRGVCGCLRMC